MTYRFRSCGATALNIVPSSLVRAGFDVRRMVVTCVYPMKAHSWIVLMPSPWGAGWKGRGQMCVCVCV